jgi:DNA-binding PucR family transcriptional regulator
VHANTVRYRLRRIADVCGQTPTEARGAFVLRFALALGRLPAAAPDTEFLATGADLS